MEPTLPTPIQSESYPTRPVEGSQATEQYSKIESADSVGTAEKVGEMHPVVTSPVQPVQFQAMPQQPVAQPTATQPTQPSAGSTPLIADDVDVIEKEWVDKAKKIVSATKEDPHMQEKQVSALQADYLMKRYNKKIKLAE